MKHNILRINGEVKTVDCELGSGILDKNGREIFEGDQVKADGETSYYVASTYDFWTKQLEEFGGGENLEIIGHEPD